MQELDLVRQLDDDALILNLDRSVRVDRHATVRVLAHMGEVDARGLFRDRGYCSMFDYALRKLHMSEAEAALRIRVARLGRKFPEALEMFARGELHLTALNLLAPVLKAENVELLQQARFQSKQRVLELLAQHDPKPDVPSSIRRLPQRKPTSTPPHASPAWKAATPTAPAEMAQPAATMTENASAVRSGSPVHSASVSTHPKSCLTATGPCADPRSERCADPQADPASDSVQTLCTSAVVVTSSAIGEGAARPAASGVWAGGLRACAQCEVDPGIERPATRVVPAPDGTQSRRAEPGVMPDGEDARSEMRARSAFAWTSGSTDDGAQVSAEPGVMPDGEFACSEMRAHSAFAWVSGSTDDGAQVSVDARVAAPAAGGDPMGFRLSMPVSSSAVVPLSAASYKVTFTACQRVRNKLEEAQALLRHRLPSRELEPLFELALDSLLSEHKKQRFAQTSRPRRVASARRSKPGSRHVASEVRRRVWDRDGGRCCFTAPDGTRCDARSFLEFHHVEPFARGGVSTADNLVLLCRSHNALFAERDYGREYIESRRARATKGSREADSCRSRDEATAPDQPSTHIRASGDCASPQSPTRTPASGAVRASPQSPTRIPASDELPAFRQPPTRIPASDEVPGSPQPASDEVPAARQPPTRVPASGEVPACRQPPAHLRASDAVRAPRQPPAHTQARGEVHAPGSDACADSAHPLITGHRGEGPSPRSRTRIDASRCSTEPTQDAPDRV